MVEKKHIEKSGQPAYLREMRFIPQAPTQTVILYSESVPIHTGQFVVFVDFVGIEFA